MGIGDGEPDLAARVVVVPAGITPSTYGICELQGRLYIFTPCCGRLTKFVSVTDPKGAPGTPVREAYHVRCSGCLRDYRGFSNGSTPLTSDLNSLRIWIQEWTGLEDVEVYIDDSSR